MEVELVEEKSNVLLKRREVKFRVTYAGATPKREEVKSKLVAVLNSDRNMTVLDYLRSDYGSHSAEGYVKVYADAEAMKVEPSYKLKRNFESRKDTAEGGAEKKPEEADASVKEGEPKKVEAKKEEPKKVEAKKEEPKKEEAKKEEPKKEEAKKEGK